MAERRQVSGEGTQDLCDPRILLARLDRAGEVGTISGVAYEWARHALNITKPRAVACPLVLEEHYENRRVTKNVGVAI